MPTLPEPVRVTIADDGLPYSGRRGLLVQTLSFVGKGVVRFDDGGELNGRFIVIGLERLMRGDGTPSRGV